MAQTNDNGKCNSMSLYGDWYVRLDPYGLERCLFDFPGNSEKITLPASLDQAAKGYSNQRKYLDHLTRKHEYIGVAWYQRTITIPQNWQNKRVELYLERPHWETTVWLNKRNFGRQNSLSVPHVYDLGQVDPGEYLLSVRVDNTVKIAVGDAGAKGGDMNLAHSITDHTQTNWNGIVGKIELRANDKVWVDNVQIYPDIKNSSAKLIIKLRNVTGNEVAGHLELMASSDKLLDVHNCTNLLIPFKIESGCSVVEASYPMAGCSRWDEFNPDMYKLTVNLKASWASETYSDMFEARFGMREFKASGRQFTLNGKAVFLRGTLECCIFPLTGFPPSDIESWRRLIGIAKAHGLNHIRFHSYCPPEAAFAAADEMGFMLQVEGPFWAEFGVDPAVDEFAYAEANRILNAYGNHPSFCLMTISNEPTGLERNDYLAKLLTYLKSTDDRRLYTSGAGWPILAENDYHCTPAPRAHQWGDGLTSRFNSQPFSSNTDYTSFISQYNVPVVSHEIGQWCSYPDYSQIDKYNGVLKAYNLKHFYSSLKARGLQDKASSFTMASGRLQTLLYKEEIEAALRTPEFGGFQLLSIYDYPGQGTGLTGVLDAFWDSKGYVRCDEFRSFCSETVPLARMDKVVWKNSEVLTADIEVAHFGEAPLDAATILWRLKQTDGKMLSGGRFSSCALPIGSGISIGRLEIPLFDFIAPQHLVLKLMIEKTPYANQWDLWLYPDEVTLPADIHITEKLDPKSLDVLRRGDNVLLIASANDVKNSTELGFTTTFWNTAWTMQAPSTLGILCDPKHPALSHFPTQFHSNWQWWELVHEAKCLDLQVLNSDIDPIIWVIDDWRTNHKLALAFEARLEGGNLLVCSANISSPSENRIVARQLLYSLLRYMQSPKFKPDVEIEIFDLEQLGGLK